MPAQSTTRPQPEAEQVLLALCRAQQGNYQDFRSLHTIADVGGYDAPTHLTELYAVLSDLRALGLVENSMPLKGFFRLTRAGRSAVVAALAATNEVR